MRKVINLVDVGYTRIRKNLRARRNLSFRQREIEAHYASKYAVPNRLYVECTNVCNARCVFCYYPKIADTHPRRYMDVESFRRILMEFKRGGGVEVGLTPTVGDPFIDPHFPERIRVLNDVGIDTFLYTNLIHVSAKIERALRSVSGFRFTVNASVAGFDREAYARLMGVDRFEDMKRNLPRVRDIARGNPNFKLAVRLQDYYGSDASKKAFVEFLDSLDIPYSVNTLVDTWGGLVEQEIDRVGELEKRPRLARIGPCRISYLKPLVTVDLKLKLCDCRDVKNELIVGDLASQSLQEAWSGDEAKRIRASMYDPQHMPEICSKCEMYVSIFDHKE
ncbi:MAG TPA: radical SAM protein [Burkholderiales bacterium]|nr:radical SAM protein [Burkholderiales bacterium]